ncbi:MAG: hypothetical protein ACRD2A_03275 [Vicinamibacterales bacterium]
MSRGTTGDQDLVRALESYRLAAHAEADAHFDDRALEVQRHRILDRLAHLGQSARVIRFPIASHSAHTRAVVSRRWVSVSAAAGLLLGLVSGQLVHFFPPTPSRAVATVAPANLTQAPSPAFAPVLISAPDDGLLGEIELAVRFRSATELQVLDELTPLHEPR